MIDESTYDELDRFLTGRLNANKAEEFEHKLQASEELNSELSWLKSTAFALQPDGRTVMKQHIASVISSVPEKEIKKYRPSKNGPSFWKKWWWVVAAIAVAVAITMAVAGSVGNNEHSRQESSGHNEYNGGETNSVADNNIVDDSSSPAISDNSPGSSYEEKHPTIETVELQPNTKANEKSELYHDFDDDSVLRPIVVQGSPGYQLTEASQNKKAPMHVILNVRNNPPFTYKLDTALTLNSAYTTARNFVFSGQGDTVYMTDHNSKTFMLLRNKGELPLTPDIRVNK